MPATAGRFAFGDVLVSARENRGQSREALADALCRSVRTVERWERGENRPRRAVLVKLAQLLDVPLEQLDGGR